MKKKIFFLLLVLLLMVSCKKEQSVKFIDDGNGHQMYKNDDGIYVRNDWYGINGNKYYFDGNGYLMKDTWIDDYYVDESGKMKTNFWKEYGDSLFYLGNDGKYIKDGLFDIEGKKFFFDKSGKLITNNTIIDPNDKKKKIVDSRGVMVEKEGPFENNNKLYFIGKNGELAVDEWKIVNDKKVFFDSDGVQVINGFAIYDDKDNISTSSEIVKWIYIDENGDIVKSGWVQYGDKWCYANEDGQLLENEWKTIDSDDYYFGQDCYMVVNDFVDNIFYVDENGKKVKNAEKTINGTKYTFDSAGKSNRIVEVKTKNANWKISNYSDTGGKYIQNTYYYKTTYMHFEDNEKQYSSSKIYVSSIIYDLDDIRFRFYYNATKNDFTLWGTHQYLYIDVNDIDVLKNDKLTIDGNGYLLLSNNAKNILEHYLLSDGNKITISIIDVHSSSEDKDYLFEIDSTGFREIYLNL